MLKSFTTVHIVTNLGGRRRDYDLAALDRHCRCRQRQCRSTLWSAPTTAALVPLADCDDRLGWKSQCCGVLGQHAPLLPCSHACFQTGHSPRDHCHVAAGSAVANNLKYTTTSTIIIAIKQQIRNPVSPPVHCFWSLSATWIVKLKSSYPIQPSSEDLL